MRRLSLSLMTLLLCLLVLPGLAQDATQGSAEHKDALEILKQLDLTMDQGRQVKAAAGTLKTQLEAAKAESRPMRRAKGMKQARDTFDAAMKSILTPQQYTHFQELVAQKRAAKQQQ